MKTRYYVFERLGGPDVLELRDEILDPPGPGQVLVRQKFVGLNFTDINLRRGDHPEPPVFPHRIGQEAAGIVAAVGSDVTEFAPGDRVAYATRPPAAYCEARLIAADRLVPVPDTVSLAAAASGLLKGMTVEFLINRTIAVQPGDIVVVYAAAGGVGQIMCSWLAAKGARVIPVVGSRSKVPAAKAASGGDTVLVLNKDDIAACVRSLTKGHMADIVYDSLGAVSFGQSLAALRPRGMFVAFGAASGQIPPIAPIRLGAQGSLFMTWARIGDYIATRQDLTASAARVFEAHEQGIISLQPQQVFGFDEAAAAHLAMERSELSGSSVLRIPD